MTFSSAVIDFRTGFVSNTCQIRYTCSSQCQQRLEVQKRSTWHGLSPGRSRALELVSIYKGEVSVCLSVCLSVCPYVRASLEDGQSDLGRISLAHAEFIQVESQTAVVFLTSPTTTPFPADRARFRSRANISGTARRVSAEFRLPVPDVGRYAPSVSSIAGDVGKGKIFLLISGSRKNTPTVVCRSATVEELPCSMHLLPETPATSSKRRRSAGPSK